MPVWTVIDHTEIGSGGAASWSKTSIPSSYDHLLLVASIRSSKSSNYDKVELQMGNGSLDTGTNYSKTFMYASDSTPNSSRDDGQTGIEKFYITANSATADAFGTIKIWIPNYANTTNYKQVVGYSTAENVSASGTEWLISNIAGLWSSTSAVDCVGIKETGDDLMQYSTFTLYGLTGA